jgi:hypothetical protein
MTGWGIIRDIERLQQTHHANLEPARKMIEQLNKGVRTAKASVAEFGAPGCGSRIHPDAGIKKRCMPLS